MLAGDSWRATPSAVAASGGGVFLGEVDVGRSSCVFPGTVLGTEMTRICFAVLAVAIGATSAVAADLPVKAVPPPVVAAYDWTGLYGGVDAGGERQSHDWAFNPAQPPPAPNQSWTASARSVSLGFHAGAQKQWNQFVFGVEAGVNEFIDLDWARHAGYGVGALGEGDARVTKGDIAVARLTLKLNPWGAPAVVAKY
jgi:opacity protein-like surface antigen